MIGEVLYETTFTRKFEQRRRYVPPDPSVVKCKIPGVVLEVCVESGASVREGDRLFVIEAMKMQNEVLAHGSGTVRALHATPGKVVAKGDVLVEFD
jgi:biotin carboxyl carrier protein